VLLFDLRAHGESDGSRVSGGYFERRDVLGAYEFLVERGAAPGSVGVLGRSMGAGIAIMAAAQETGIAAVVADSPFAAVDDLIAQETARKTPIPKGIVPVFLPAAKLFASTLYAIDLGELVPEDDVTRLAYPVLVIHGEADERIPASHGRRVHEGAPAGSELWLLPGVDHADAFLEQPEAYVERVVGYFGVRLGGLD
jgi:pimeloyl-ACP methyl ester carboxylesterase